MSKSGHEFSVGDHVVYPAHGVGQVQGIETQEVAGMKLEVYVITFDHEKMTLRVPTAKAKTAGLRSQFAALPWRRDAHGEVEILLITSRETRRWVIPKGWPIKAMSSGASCDAGRSQISTTGTPTL